MRKGKGKGNGTNRETTLPLLTSNNNLSHSYASIICYEGERLIQLLESIHMKIKESVTTTIDRPLPFKFLLKQNLLIGVNEVTRVLERMPPADHPHNPVLYKKAPPIHLQAILLASDSSSRPLVRHLPSLASSRKVPLIFVKDKKGGSLKLGELVQLKTSIAIGVKAKGNAINKLMEGIISVNEAHNDIES